MSRRYALEIREDLRRYADTRCYCATRRRAHKWRPFDGCAWPPMSPAVSPAKQARRRDAAARHRALPRHMRQEMGAAAGWQCFYCERTGDASRDPDGTFWHWDHYVPRSRSGSHGPENAVLACARCNVQKGTADGAEYLEFLGRAPRVPNVYP